jgi:hypothetical protein
LHLFEADNQINYPTQLNDCWHQLVKYDGLLEEPRQTLLNYEFLIKQEVVIKQNDLWSKQAIICADIEVNLLYKK